MVYVSISDVGEVYGFRSDRLFPSVKVGSQDLPD